MNICFQMFEHCGIFKVRETWWNVNSLKFDFLVLQTEILLFDPAGRWILQPQLLQGWEHIQGTQRNHLPWLMHGRNSGSGPYAPSFLNEWESCWILKKHVLCPLSFRTARSAGLPSSWRCRIRARSFWLRTVKLRWTSGSAHLTRSSTAALSRPCRRRGTEICTTVCLQSHFSLLWQGSYLVCITKLVLHLQALHRVTLAHHYFFI